MPEVSRKSGPEAAESLRLERGIPRFGVDFTERNNPVEAGLQYAISFTKGCYVGQEVVSKATYVGGVSRRLVRLRIAEESAAPAGTDIIDDGGKKVGVVTSSAYSPEFRSAIAFGYVKSRFACPGIQVAAAYPGGRLVEAEVM